MGDRARPWAWGGVALIWAFLALFLVYPLCRIFYDAVTDEAGRLTLANFAAFFTDRFYLRSLWNSLVLGAVTVVTSSILGHRRRAPPRALRVLGAEVLGLPHDDPDHLPAAGRACSASPSSSGGRGRSTCC